MSLNATEIRALIVFWNRYMTARKDWNAFADKMSRLGKWATNSSNWSDYLNAKMHAMNDLTKIIPEANATAVWKHITCLRPEAVVKTILNIRKNNQQRKTEKQILTGKIQ